jgi:hypothetical protein
MIIKSMTRKTVSFKQLLTYINKENAGQMHNIFHNLYGQNQAELVHEFEQNAALLPNRKNGVVIFHEIFSITKSEQLSIDQQKHILQTITQNYINQRAPNNLVFAGLHDNKKHNLHYHIVISSNEVNSKKRLRLSKAKFNKIKQDLEAQVLRQYPELNQDLAINKKATNKQSKSASELQRRTGALPQKEMVKQQLSTIFQTAKTQSEFTKMMERAGFETYVRGKQVVVKVIETGRKHRLQTLKLQEDFAACTRRIEQKPQSTVQPPQHAEEPVMINRREPPNIPEPMPIEEIDHELTESHLYRAVDEVINEVNNDIQIAADFIRGPSETAQERLEAKKLEFFKREQMKMLRQQKSKAAQNTRKR